MNRPEIREAELKIGSYSAFIFGPCLLIYVFERNILASGTCVILDKKYDFFFLNKTF